MSNKLRILFQSDFALSKSGFGRNTRETLTCLYKTGKYEICNYACSMQQSDPMVKRTPWKTITALPENTEVIKRWQQDQGFFRMAAYGSERLDEVVKEFKPDVIIGVQDIWGLSYAFDKPWFKDIPYVLWTTLDSLPVLKQAVDVAPKLKNYWVWSNFAEKALHKLGHNHVKTVHGCVNHKPFYRLSDNERRELRSRLEIDQDTYIAGFVFRNQLRKTVPKLIEGFKQFKDKNNIDNAKLLLHTSWSESQQGWDIENLCKEFGLDLSDILTTYICQKCNKYEVKNYSGEGIACKHCGTKNSQITPNVRFGVRESQLNEIYNLMDVYVHPFTSGGQEIPIQEAKLTELITLVTNYSCGEELCEDKYYSLPLKYSEYWEQGTNFRKATTSAEDIADKLKFVYNLPEQERVDWGQKARKSIIDNYSPEAVCKKIEEFLDTIKPIPKDFDWDFKPQLKNPDAQIEDIEDEVEWITSLYKNILNTDPDKQGLNHWVNRLKTDLNRQQVVNFFRQIAQNENSSKKKVNLSDLLEDNGRKRILITMPESIGDIYILTSLFESIAEVYPEYDLYVATKPAYHEILKGNEYVKKVLPFHPEMENILAMEGIKNNKKFFDICFVPHVGTQRMLTYLHNGEDRIQFDINK